MNVTPRKTGDFTTSTQIFKLSIASIVVGALSAFIAIVLLKMTYFLTNLFFYHRLSLVYITPTHNNLHMLVLAPPIIGGLIIGLIARYGSEKIRGHGIPEAIEAMLLHESKVKPKVAFWKPISAAISIGSGGPFGTEGPIIMTGGSVGSLVSQFLHFSSVERRILLVAGAAGGMSATFAAPVSSVLFAVELLVFEFKPRSLVPIALSSAVADAIRIVLLGPGPVFSTPSLAHVPWTLLGASVLIGVAGSLLAILLTWAIYAIEDAFRKLPVHWMWWPAIGAVVIGIGGLFSPRALGVGYDSIGAMLNVKLAVTTLITLLVAKTIIWVIALGSGTSGGILAPILIIGGSLGGGVGELLHVPHPGVWALLGMSAIFSGVTRTPFTSVIFPMELTHNLGALLPLLFTSSIATGLSSYILPRSILTEKIARRGLHLTREYQADPLQMHVCKEIAWLPAPLLPAHARVGDLADDLLSLPTSQTWLGVEGCKEHHGGLVSVVEMFRQAKLTPHSQVHEHVVRAPMMRQTDTAKFALDRMLSTESDWAKVMDEDGVLVGFITLQQLLVLRKREHTEEHSRQQVFSGFRAGSYRIVSSDQQESQQLNV